MTTLTKGLTLLFFLVLYEAHVLTQDLVIAGIISCLVTVVLFVSIWLYLTNEQLKADTNRRDPVYIVGNDPDTGEFPELGHLRKHVVLVYHSEVNKVAKKWRKRLSDANNLHLISDEVYELTYQQPINKQAALEPLNGEGSYAERVTLLVKDTLGEKRHTIHSEQQLEYRRIAMGQAIVSDE